MYLDAREMGKWIEKPKYNVISIRITDKEKAQLDEIKRHTRKSISLIIREAITSYSHNEDYFKLE